MYFPKTKYRTDLITPCKSKHKTPNSLGSSLSIRSLSCQSLRHLPRHLLVMGIDSQGSPPAYSLWPPQYGSKSLVEQLESSNFQPNRRNGAELPDTFLDLSHFLICFFHLRYWNMFFNATATWRERARHIGISGEFVLPPKITQTFQRINSVKRKMNAGFNQFRL